MITGREVGKYTGFPVDCGGIGTIMGSRGIAWYGRGLGIPYGEGFTK